MCVAGSTPAGGSMVTKEYLDTLIGSKIELVFMPNDPDPILPGSIGTVTGYYLDKDSYQLWMNWDDNRGLNLICPPDVWKIKV